MIGLAARVAQLRAQSAYRLAATEAYGKIVLDRLASLNPGDVEGYQSLDEFNNRRVLPALRTCEYFGARLEALAERIEQTASLLRARIETTLQLQNRDMLMSLKMTADRQLRLQHLVEGLSIFAVGYYALGLLSYVLEGSEAIIPMRSSTLLALLVLPTLVLLMIALRWQRNRALKAPVHSLPGSSR